MSELPRPNESVNERRAIHSKNDSRAEEALAAIAELLSKTANGARKTTSQKQKKRNDYMTGIKNWI